jgi:hypothetical protein
VNFQILVNLFYVYVVKLKTILLSFKMKRFYKSGKFILHLFVLFFLFADAANLLDLFTDSTVIHFEGDSPDSTDDDSAILNSSAPCEMAFPKSADQKQTRKDLIFDQDSPSIVHEILKDCQNIFTLNKSKNTTPESQTKNKPLYIEYCQLQI